MKRVAIVVLGDVGRSPRMQYHALSFAKAQVQVDLIGYSGACLSESCEFNFHKISFILFAGNAPRPEVSSSPYIEFRRIRSFPSLPRVLFLLYAPIKIFFQILQLFWILLFSITKPNAIMGQCVCVCVCLCVYISMMIVWIFGSV